MQRQMLYALVGLAVLASLAGCSAAGSLSMDPVDDDEELAELTSRSPEETGYPDEEARAIVERALENGTATANGTEPPVSEGLPVAAGGSYYDLGWEIVDSHTEYDVGFMMDINATDVSGETIPVEELPEPDRRAVQELIDEMETRQPEPREGFEVETGARYTDAAVRESVLVESQTYNGVVSEGETYRIRVESRSVTVNTYEYSATTVAANTSAYAAQLRQSYDFTLNSLSGDERDIVDEAANGTYYADSTDDDAFDSLVDRFIAHDALERDRDGKWLVRYDGQLYVATMDYSQFVEDEG